MGVIYYMYTIVLVASRQEYWSGLPFPSPGDFPDPGIEPIWTMEPWSPTSQADSLPSEPPGKPCGLYMYTAAKSLQSCPTLCDPVDGSLLHPWDSPGKNAGVGCHFPFQCMKVKSESEVAQSCLTLCDPMDCSLPGSSVHGIFQARVLEWVAIAFSRYVHYILTKLTGKTCWVKADTKGIHTIYLHKFLELVKLYHNDRNQMSSWNRSKKKLIGKLYLGSFPE